MCIHKPIAEDMAQLVENRWTEQPEQQQMSRFADAFVTVCVVVWALASISGGRNRGVLFEIARGQEAAAIPKAWLTGGYSERVGCNETENIRGNRKDHHGQIQVRHRRDDVIMHNHRYY